MAKTNWWPEHLKRSLVYYLIGGVACFWLVNRDDLKVKRLVYYYGLYQEIAKGSYPAAVRYHEIVSTVKPGDPEQDYYLGWMHLQERQYASAVRSFRRAVAIAPRDERLRFWLIRALLADKKVKEAGQQAIILLEKGQNARVLTETGSLFASILWLDVAQMFYQKASALAPGDAVIDREWGKMYANMGQYDRAETVWLRALEKNPQDSGLVVLIEQARQLKKAQGRPSTVRE